MRTYTVYNSDTGSKIAENLKTLKDVKHELRGMKGHFEAIRSDDMYVNFVNSTQETLLSKYRN